MTKFNEEFKDEIRKYYKTNSAKKKYKNSKSFTSKNVADKYNLTFAQVHRILYGNKKPFIKASLEETLKEDPQEQLGKMIYSGAFMDNKKPSE